MEDGSCSEINQFDDVTVCHDAVIKLEVPMGQTEFMEVLHTVAYLAENAVNLRSRHHSGHDDAKKVIRGIFHDLIREG